MCVSGTSLEDDLNRDRTRRQLQLYRKRRRWRILFLEGRWDKILGKDKGKIGATVVSRGGGGDDSTAALTSVWRLTRRDEPFHVPTSSVTKGVHDPV